MGNKSSNPLSSYDEATRTYSHEEIEAIRSKFKAMCHPNQETLRLENFVQITTSPVLRKRLLPRLFEIMDTKRENEINFESYICTLLMLRRNNNEEISKFLLLLYGAPKSKTMRRENVSDLLLDANTTYAENDCDNFDELHHRSTCMQDLSNGMVEVVFHKYSTVQSEKLTFPEFCEFVRHEDCVRRLVWLLPSCLGERVGSASSVD